MGILRIDPQGLGILCQAAGRVGPGEDRGTLGHDPADHPVLPAGAPLGRLYFKILWQYMARAFPDPNTQ